jgi:hypothetical protein
MTVKIGRKERKKEYNLKVKIRRKTDKKLRTERKDRKKIDRNSES